ncbi:MAG: TetR/AcrR family transcriptional regulator [Lachnospirales bacterium]
MEKKTDLRIIKSKNAIKNAFLDLMEEKGYANITITDIAKRAMINRKTFYIHFETKEALYNSISNELLSILSPTLNKLQNLEGKEQRQYVINMLLHFKEHKDIFNILIKDKTNPDFLNKLKEKLKYDLFSISQINKRTEGTNFTPELLSEAFFSLFVVLIQWWLNESTLPVNDVIDMIIDFFSKKTLEVLGINFDYK